MTKKYNTIRRRKEQTKWNIVIAFTVAGVIGIGVSYISFLTPLQAQITDTLEISPRGKFEALEVLVGTPMEEAIPHIKKASEYYGVPYELYLGIANAESSFKNFPQGSYNPVGLKPSNQLKYYNSWEHSVNYWFHLVKEYYWNEGLVTCKQIERKYVGYLSGDWVNNCSKYFK